MCLIWTVNIICCLPMFKFPFDGQRITRFLFLIYISTFNVFIPTFIVQKKMRFFFSFFFFSMSVLNFIFLPIYLHLLSCFLPVWWRAFESQFKFTDSWQIWIWYQGFVKAFNLHYSCKKIQSNSKRPGKLWCTFLFTLCLVKPWLHIYYAHLAFMRSEHSVCRGSLMTTYIMLLA